MKRFWLKAEAKEISVAKAHLKGRINMKLPKGITGYGTEEERAIRPIADMDFKRICYSVAQMLKAKLIECKISFDMFSNHYYAIFQVQEQVITVLYVPTHAYMAFSYGEYKFIDNSDLAKAFMSLGDFHILTK
jgi:hypothetical protein